MRTRIVTGIVLLLIAIPMLLIGGVYFNLFLLAVSGLIGHEIVLLFQFRWPRYLRWVMVLIPPILLVFLYFNVMNLFTSIILLMLFLIVVNIVDYRFDLEDLTMILYLYIIILSAFYQVMKMRSLVDGLALVGFVALVSYGTDTFAYFSGYFFGKHKLNERISPKKTIEGAIGGTIMGSLLGFLVLLLSTKGYGIVEMMALSLILSIAGQFGDLAFSSIKRHYRIKDFSNLLPGHGGIIDRVDSLMLNLVVMMILMPYLLGVML